MNAYKYALYSGITRVLANVLTLAAVAVGMYQASLDPDSSLSMFCSWFFGLATPLWIMTAAIHSWLRRRYPTPEREDAPESSTVQPGVKA